MDKIVFKSFCDLIYRTSGINLNENKEALLSARIAKRLRELEISDHNEYLRYLQNDSSGEELVRLLDVISTNVTHFFREPEHFDVLAAKLKKSYDAGQRRFRIWSAGCSSGEEPYSIAMTICETIGCGTADIRILATDISTRMLERCAEGLYNDKNMESVPVTLRHGYFHRLPDRRNKTGDTIWQVDDRLRSMILFRRLNLANVPFPMQGPMDAIFCRNVMIYFDNTVRSNLLGEFCRLLREGGYLFVGHAESLAGMLGEFKTVKPSVYVKR